MVRLFARAVRLFPLHRSVIDAADIETAIRIAWANNSRLRPLSHDANEQQHDQDQTEFACHQKILVQTRCRKQRRQAASEEIRHAQFYIYSDRNQKTACGLATHHSRTTDSLATSDCRGTAFLHLQRPQRCNRLRRHCGRRHDFAQIYRILPALHGPSKNASNWEIWVDLFNRAEKIIR
jgi:hypothetical protein